MSRFLSVKIISFAFLLCSCGEISRENASPERIADCKNIEKNYRLVNSKLETARKELGFFGSLLASRATPQGRKIRQLELQQEILRKELQTFCSLVL